MKEYEVAFALAAGVSLDDDRGGEKERRRMRYNRKRAHQSKRK